MIDNVDDERKRKGKKDRKEKSALLVVWRVHIHDFIIKYIN